MDASFEEISRKYRSVKTGKRARNMLAHAGDALARKILIRYNTKRGSCLRSRK